MFDSLVGHADGGRRRSGPAMSISGQTVVDNGDTTDIYSRVVIVTEQQLVEAYERSSQRGELPPKAYRHSDVGRRPAPPVLRET